MLENEAAFPSHAAQTSKSSPSAAKQRGGVVEAFCGVGGLSHGFVLEGFDVRAGMDVDPACRYPFERNNHAVFLERDIAELSGEEVGGLFAEAERKILVGCAPCQPFSTYSHNTADEKWRLLRILVGWCAKPVPTSCPWKMFRV